MERTKEQLLKILLQHGISDMEALVHASPGNTQARKDLNDAKELIPEIIALTAENERLQRQLEDTAKAHASRCAELNKMKAALENAHTEIQGYIRDFNQGRLQKAIDLTKPAAQAPEVGE